MKRKSMEQFLMDSPFYQMKKEILIDQAKADEKLENAAILLRMGGNPCDASKIESRVNEDDIDVFNTAIVDPNPLPKKNHARVDAAVALLRRAR